MKTGGMKQEIGSREQEAGTKESTIHLTHDGGRPSLAESCGHVEHHLLLWRADRLVEAETYLTNTIVKQIQNTKSANPVWPHLPAST